MFIEKLRKGKLETETWPQDDVVYDQVPCQGFLPVIKSKQLNLIKF